MNPETALIEEVRIEGMAMAEVHYASHCVLHDHTHEGATIGIMLRGGVAERRDGLVKVQTAGDVFVRRKGVCHANQYLGEGSRSLFIELEPDDPRARAIGAHDGLAWPELSNAGQVVARVFRNTNDTNRTELRRAVRALLSAIASLCPRPTPHWLDVARERLAHDYRQPPTLRALAGELGVHPVHLAQAFRARWGLTVGAFVRAHRVFHAISLIHAGTPLAEASYACGFADQSHMTRVVRASRGAPPGRLLRGQAC